MKQLVVHLLEINRRTASFKDSTPEADLGLLQHPRWSALLPAVNYYHKALHIGCCSSPRSASEHLDRLLFLNESPYLC